MLFNLLKMHFNSFSIFPSCVPTWYINPIFQCLSFISVLEPTQIFQAIRFFIIYVSNALFNHKRKKETLLFAKTQMGLEGIMLSKSPRERKILYGSTDMWNLKKKKKLVDTDREQIGIARGRDEGGENG